MKGATITIDGVTHVITAITEGLNLPGDEEGIYIAKDDDDLYVSGLVTSRHATSFLSPYHYKGVKENGSNNIW